MIARGMARRPWLKLLGNQVRNPDRPGRLRCSIFQPDNLKAIKTDQETLEQLPQCHDFAMRTGPGLLRARPGRQDIGQSSAVAPRNHVQMRPAHFFNRRPRNAHVVEQPVVKFEKFPVLVSSIPPQDYSGQPRQRDFPGPARIWKSGGSCVESVD
jgi:hypothetical protein